MPELMPLWVSLVSQSLLFLLDSGVRGNRASLSSPLAAR